MTNPLTMTADAQELYDRYLKTVRWSVRGVADADEIERDVREHVVIALQQAEQPIPSSTLRDVLSRLGDPWQWVPAEELPWWRRILMRFSVSSEDWRLAYLCFGLTLLGFILLPIGIGAFILVAAFCLARATHELAADRDGTMGARRWLVYPVLGFFSALLVTGLLMGPGAAIVGWGLGDGGFRQTLDFARFPYHHMFLELSVASVAMGTWWIVLSLLAMLLIRPLRWMVKPFADGLRRVHLFWLTALGVIAVAAGVAPFVF
jgi:hypothetical protein